MDQNPYQPPQSDLTTPEKNAVNYAGFWIRVAASIIDSVLIALITVPTLIGIYGMEYLESEQFVSGIWDVLISWVFPAFAIITFWIYRSATPGKMLLNLKIVDTKTHEKPSPGQCIGRYLGYFVSMIPLMLGIIWVAFDKKKQGWHDKLAGTVVLRARK